VNWWGFVGSGRKRKGRGERLVRDWFWSISDGNAIMKKAK